MYPISIDDSQVNCDSTSIYQSILWLLTDDATQEYNPPHRFILIGELVGNINDPKFLSRITESIRDFDCMPDCDEILKVLDTKYLSRPEYSEKDCLKTRAIVIGALFRYVLLRNFYSEFFEKGGPAFCFDIKKRNVFVNSDEVLDFIELKSSEILLDYVKTLPSRESQKDEVSNIIFLMAENSLKYKSDVFSFERDMWKEIKDNLPTVDKKKSIYPFLKGGAEECFLIFRKNFIVDLYLDYSFIYAKMTALGLFKKIGHVPFVDWL
ncbi:hypothetical protein LCGC14_0634210, partial [marine sediment metagenome]